MFYYEVWGLHPGNLIATAQTEEDAVRIVRDLLEAGWSIDRLSLSLESDDETDDQSPLPVWEGAELERLVHATV